MFVRYDASGNQIRHRYVLDCSECVPITEQSHKAEVDINNIVKRHGMDLIQKVARLQEWTYDDVAGNDFQESMNAIIKARDTFAAVPSEIRKQFDNDPAKFMDFVHNPENQENLVQMGLAIAPEVIQPIDVNVVTQTPEPAGTTPE